MNNRDIYLYYTFHDSTRKVHPFLFNERNPSIDPLLYRYTRTHTTYIQKKVTLMKRERGIEGEVDLDDMMM